MPLVFARAIITSESERNDALVLGLLSMLEDYFKEVGHRLLRQTTCLMMVHVLFGQGALYLLFLDFDFLRVAIFP